jgi:protein FrlC
MLSIFPLIFPLKQTRFAMGNFQYIRYPLELFMDTAARLGYAYVELWAAAPHLLPEVTDVSRQRRIKRELDARGLKVCCVTPEQVTYPYNIASQDEKLLSISLEYFKGCLDLACGLEAPYMLVTAGCGYFDEPRQAAWERSCASITIIAEYAAERGVSLLYETLTPPSSNILNTPQQMAETLSCLPGNIGAIADLGQIAYMKQNLSDYVDLLGEKLKHVHVHDFGEAIHMALGEGVLPVAEQIAYLEERGYKGLYSFEINDVRYRENPALSDEKSLKWLKDHGVVDVA